MKTGIVLKSTGSNYQVKTSDGAYLNCKIKGKFRIKNLKTTNPVTVGDKVEYIYDEQHGQALITGIFERKNYIIRKSTNLSKLYHIIASNIDHAYLVVTADYPKTTLEFIDRFLITAEAYQIPASLIINKIDLYKNKEQKAYLEEVRMTYNLAGYETIEISATENTHVDIVKEKVKNKINLFSGNSGVGKSTLIHAIDSGISRKIREISDYHKMGKHTTTFPEMLELNQGGYIIDTPGIKGFGLIDFTKEELYHYFPEIFKKSKECQFHNCIHIHEPGCAVIEAVENAEISYSRYRNYVNIYHENDGKYRTKF